MCTKCNVIFHVQSSYSNIGWKQKLDVFEVPFRNLKKLSMLFWSEFLCLKNRYKCSNIFIILYQK